MINVLIVPAGAGSLGIIDALKELEDINIFAGDLSPYASGFLRDEVKQYMLPPVVSEEDKYISELISIVEEEKIDVLLPGYDYDVLAISKNLHKIGEKVSVLLPPYEKVEKAHNTWHSIEIVKDAGIPHPKCWRFESEEEIKASDFEFPLFVKPGKSMGGRGAYRVNSPSELIYRYRKVKEDYENPIIQEVIPGEVGSMHVVGLLYDKEGQINSSFVCHSLRTNFSWGGGGVVGEPVENERLVNYAQKIVRSMGGWKGPINMEFMIDPRDEKPKFIEINPRIWGYNYVATVNGINFPKRIVDICLDREVPPKFNYDLENILILDWDEVVISSKN